MIIISERILLFPLDKQITKDSNDVGPQDELKYYQRRLERYEKISEFIASRPFVNHLTCLQFTRAKLLKVLLSHQKFHSSHGYVLRNRIPQKWKRIEAEFNMLRLESENNVKSLQGLKPFWEPLYTFTPTENCEPIHRLVSALRDLYNDSKNYNKSECVTSFLVKTTNQLVIACRKYLDNNGKLEVLKQEPSLIIQKISVS